MCAHTRSPLENYGVSKLLGCSPLFVLALCAFIKFRRKFFTQWVVMHRNRLPKEAVDVPSLEAFKARQDVAQGSLVWWLATLHTAGG